MSCCAPAVWLQAPLSGVKTLNPNTSKVKLKGSLGAGHVVVTLAGGPLSRFSAPLCCLASSDMSTARRRGVASIWTSWYPSRSLSNSTGTRSLHVEAAVGLVG